MVMEQSLLELENQNIKTKLKPLLRDLKGNIKIH